MKKSLLVITGIALDERTTLSLGELCRVGKITADHVLDMIEEGVLEPQGKSPADWRFDAIDLKRLQITVRLQQDLRVNLAGAALALDLLDELETLRRQLLTLR